MSNLTNIEFKAKVHSTEPYETKLKSLQPEYIGMDHQIDHYFNTKNARLKLRVGNIENALIHYERPDTNDVKKSRVILYKHSPDDALKNILTAQLGIKAVVDKIRKIYFIGNVKFHFDLVQNLGTFIEVEAINYGDSYTIEQLQAQCDHYFNFFSLNKEDLIAKSYSDLIMESKV
jgi:adenylate cyclase, class 2